VPFVDSVARTIDQRTITTSFAAEQTLTSDTVPVNVDAVLFWMVHDAEKAALEVRDYPQAVSVDADSEQRCRVHGHGRPARSGRTAARAPGVKRFDEAGQRGRTLAVGAGP
jgi:SPFH domain/Band 7 family protein